MTTSAAPLFVVGIDVGGTNTDAVLLEFGSSAQRAHLCDPRAPAPSSASTLAPSPGAGDQVRLAGGRSARLVASVKVPTTACFTGGIHHAIVELLGCLREKKSGRGHTDEEAAGDERNVVAVMIGTTVFLNALLQAGDENAPSKLTGSSGRQLSLGRVACVRLCGPLTRGLPPFSEFPNGLAAAVKGPVYFVDGGFEFDQQIVKPLDERQLRAIGEQLVELSKSGAEDPNRGSEVNVAITGVFSPLYCEQEVRAAEVIGEVLRGAGVEHSITLSHRIGNLSFLERENATILNAALRPLACRTIRDLRRALHELGLVNALQHVYLTQNDGTVFSLEEAVEYPILTLNSGPVNSVRGAAALSESGVHDALVADIGGTSTDVAVLVGSFPRPAGTSVEVAGVRTNFRMPDTHSIALGGGSLVAIDPQVAIGPVSVGNQLFQQAICFGGRILTLTDVAIASGITRIYGADAVRVNVRSDKLAAVEEEMLRMLERAVDKMKTSREPVPLILVGGGSALVREGVSLKGVSAIVRPPHFDVANAVGAAIGQLSASVEQVVDLTGLDSDAISRVKHEIEERSRNAVIEKGAQPDGIEVITDKIHLTYVIGQCVRFVCKAIGNLDIQKWAGEMDMTRSAAPNTKRQQEPASFELHEYRPPVARPEVFSTLQFTDPIIEYNRVTRRREWVLRAEDIEYMALGAGILACSGGGSPHIGKLEVLRCLSGSHSQSQPLRIIALESLADDEVTLMCSCYGAPLMMIERLPSAEKLVRSVLEMKTRFDLELPDEAQRRGRSDGGDGNGSGKRRRLAALVCAEIGGMNSLEPLRAAALLGLPVLDVDLMGRAFPQLQMCTSFIYGECPLPCALSGEYGDVLVLTEAEVPNKSAKRCEELLRAHATSHFGIDAGVSTPPLDRATLERIAIQHSMSRIWRLGRLVLRALALKENPLLYRIHQELERKESARQLCIGKIIDVTRYTQGGYNVGAIELEGFDEFNGRSYRIEFMNENLVCRELDASKTVPSGDGSDGSTGLGARVLARVPDLISLVDADRFTPVLVEQLRYGLRVRVLSFPAHPLLLTPTALAVVGPTAFGYESDPYGYDAARNDGIKGRFEYREPLSVFTEFAQPAAANS